MWLYLDTDEKPQDKTIKIHEMSTALAPQEKNIKIHEMSTALASALIDSANGDNNSSEIEIEGGGVTEWRSILGIYPVAKRSATRGTGCLF